MLIVDNYEVLVPEKKICLLVVFDFTPEAISNDLREALFTLLSMLLRCIPGFTNSFSFKDHCLAGDFTTTISKENSSKLVWITSLKQVLGDQTKSEVLFRNINALDFFIWGCTFVEDKLNFIVEFVHCDMDYLSSFFNSLNHVRKLAKALN